MLIIPVFRRTIIFNPNKSVCICFALNSFEIQRHVLSPETPMGDQDRISPFNINKELSGLVRRIKMTTQLGDFKLIQYQIPQIEVIIILRQTVGRIT